MHRRVVAVTGCLGFMGSHFVRACLARGWKVWGIDKMTYAARPGVLEELSRVAGHDDFHFTKADILEMQHLFEVDLLVNFAAETHVDNSIMDPANFVRTNVDGVQNLLELVRGKNNYEMPTFVQISTDEVYGDAVGAPRTEDDPLRPSNPYSASKAAADMLILGWHRTFDVPYKIVRPSNNYGVGQYPEKLIPKAVKYLGLGKPVPIHGDGSTSRTWLHVEDFVAGLMKVIDDGAENAIYNLPGAHEAKNLEVVRAIVDAFFDGAPPRPFEELVKTHYVRIGEDVRYAMSNARVARLGWKPVRVFDDELRKLVRHFRENFVW
ncbi:MAG TPA: GDP-mannose 4,6-dehydratase [Polyangia bacterium]|nr:GDP-mannose 4,6-dehydratase [Polyangia bacterium]